MRDKGDINGNGLEPTTSKCEYLEFARAEVRRVVAGGASAPKVYQSKRYIPVDSIRVDGRIVDVVLNLGMEDRIAVTRGDKPIKPAATEAYIPWLDDNGRAIY